MIQMASLGMNPYSSPGISSSVLSFELKDTGKRNIPVAGLSENIRITIPTNPINEDELAEKSFAKPSQMKYHFVHVKRAGTAVKMKLTTKKDTAAMALFVKLNARPSVSDSEHNFTIPDTSICAQGNLDDCRTDDPYSVTVVTRKAGILHIGIVYLEDIKLDEHPRARRSCFGRGRQKRSCVGIKDAPPKGSNETVIPTYDPTTDLDYTMSISQTSCLYWSDEEQKWTSAGCQVIQMFQSVVVVVIFFFQRETNNFFFAYLLSLR